MSKKFVPLRYGQQLERPLKFLTPYPREIQEEKTVIDLDAKGLSTEAPLLKEELKALEIPVNTASALSVHCTEKDLGLPSGGYELSISGKNIEITGQDSDGIFYAEQTLLQIIGFLSGKVPVLKVRDWPQYKVRAVMLDMGRGVYRKELILKIIRRIAALKYNCLHLHLYDDHLIGLKFNTVPLGIENPEAITMNDLREIIDYAEKYHISVCPELESWGHVSAILCRYPELEGGQGMWEGRSFGISPRTFDLLGRMYDEVVDVVKSGTLFHLGLDEACWRLLPDLPDPEHWTPERLVGKLHTMLQETAARHRKKLTTVIWADNGGRPVPEEFRNEIVLEPWGYLMREEKEIMEKIRKFTGQGTPFLMGAGSSSEHYCGTFSATSLWCKQAVNSVNCLGATVCIWETNDFMRQFISVYGAATPLWNPNGQEVFPEDMANERLFDITANRANCYQTLFEDASEAAIMKARGPRVYRGYYLDGPHSGEMVAPTVGAVKTTPR